MTVCFGNPSKNKLMNKTFLYNAYDVNTMPSGIYMWAYTHIAM